MTKKSFNSLLRFDPELGKNLKGETIFTHQHLRPLRLLRRSLDHATKMKTKGQERALLAQTINQGAHTRMKLAYFVETIQAMNRKHGVGSHKRRAAIRAAAALEQFGIAA